MCWMAAVRVTHPLRGRAPLTLRRLVLERSYRNILPQQVVRWREPKLYETLWEGAHYTEPYNDKLLYSV
jgi:hypothetical protein